jgi:hypothetical protein
MVKWIYQKEEIFMRKVLLIPFLLLGLTACSGEDEEKSPEETSNTVEETTDNQEMKSSTAETTDNAEVDSNQYDMLVSALPGKSFISESNVEENNGSIKFYSNYEAYKKGNPDSMISEDDYKMYFDTGDGLEKILFKAPAYLFDKLPALDQLSVTLPYEGKTYSYDIKREEINDYIGADETDDELRGQFMDTFVRVE